MAERGSGLTPSEPIEVSGWLRPAQAGVALAGTARPAHIAATLVDLDIRGYLTIEQTTDGEGGVEWTGCWPAAEEGLAGSWHGSAQAMWWCGTRERCCPPCLVGRPSGCRSRASENHDAHAKPANVHGDSYLTHAADQLRLFRRTPDYAGWLRPAIRRRIVGVDPRVRVSARQHMTPAIRDESGRQCDTTDQLGPRSWPPASSAFRNPRMNAPAALWFARR